MALATFVVVPACEKPAAEGMDPPPQVEEVLLVEREHTSEALAAAFPLFPLVEKQRWGKLLDLEGEWGEASEEARVRLAEEINALGDELAVRYPFSADSEGMRLGGIRYTRETGEIEIPAAVHYPKQDQEGKEYELEVVLCNERGRVHETLLLTDVRPLHLELMLHLIGHKKKATQYRLSIRLPDEPSIPLVRLLSSTSGEALPEPLAFTFSGSAFGESYGPDTTGDLIITWHVHDAVLQARDEGIAQARTRLLVKRDPRLEEGMAVRLVLEPTDE
ncbi:hypothetical protein ACFSW8_16885 [Rubritalea tangerina]|uniref:Uncharacterized protein n=1 Tax=Rubritalea tangerina TaxID=430798 RepID=A0ABW4ZF78_9BACT